MLPALSGTTHAPFAQRLAYQVSTCQYLPADLGALGQAARVTEAVSTLKALAPANAVEAILAAQAAAAHTASLDLLQSAMAERRSPREAEARARQHARLASLLLRQLDQLTRLRGRQRQTSTAASSLESRGPATMMASGIHRMSTSTCLIRSCSSSMTGAKR